MFGSDAVATVLVIRVVGGARGMATPFWVVVLVRRVAAFVVFFSHLSGAGTVPVAAGCVDVSGAAECIGRRATTSVVVDGTGTVSAMPSGAVVHGTGAMSWTMTMLQVRVVYLFWTIAMAASGIQDLCSFLQQRGRV